MTGAEEVLPCWNHHHSNKPVVGLFVAGWKAKLTARGGALRSMVVKGREEFEPKAEGVCHTVGKAVVKYNNLGVGLNLSNYTLCP